MFETLLKQLASQPVNQVHALTPMVGVEIWRFRCTELPELAVPGQSARRYETLFCQSGGITLQMDSERQVDIKRNEIMLLSDASGIQAVSAWGEVLQGVLVTVDGSAAQESLTRLCALLNGLKVDTKQVGAIMDAHQGCTAIKRSAWGDVVFHALRNLLPEECGGYCALKAVELLYLLGSGSPLLPLSPSSACYDRHQAGTVRQVHDYMLDNLGQRLTIQQLAQQFHISPTLLKECFRKLYGQSLHQYLLNCRLERAAELLSSTPQSVLQIASAVGYESVSQFGVAFKRKYHVPPSRYRRLAEHKNV